MKMTAWFFTFFLLGLCTGAAPDKPTPSYPAMAPADQYRFASPEDEAAFARTAAPPSISDHARVLVLGKKGYETAVEGDNGFVCFVERSWTAGFDDPVFWDPKIKAPNCFNAPAVRSVLPQYLKRTEWALAGVTREQMIEKTRAAFANHEFRMPESGSFSFMLSKRGNLGDPADGGPWLPHVMLFVPHGQAKVWGAGSDGSPILGTESRAIEPTVLLIPVRRWSDGSPAPVPSEQHN
ncbi:MAG TPA: hypothetical protein VIA45_00365 [Thermoanaerobaculia bacterium]|jgi:hypothetical protein